MAEKTPVQVFKTQSCCSPIDFHWNHSMGRFAHGTGLQAFCALAGCLHHRLGGHVWRACSVGGLDGPPTALAHQLPRVAGRTPGLEPSQDAFMRQARTVPYGQHCDCCIHQPTRCYTLPSHDATHPPPPLKLEASEIDLYHSHSGLAQPGSWWAVTSYVPRRVETPSPDGPAELESFLTHSGRPVCFFRDLSLPVVLPVVFSRRFVPRVWAGWLPGNTEAPAPGYMTKVPTTPFRDQVVSLQVLPPEEADPALALLCPIRALRCYVDRMRSFRTSDRVFVCHGGRQKVNAVSKQRMAHWIVETVTLAYQAQGVSCPFRLKTHSTRSVASS